MAITIGATALGVVAEAVTSSAKSAAQPAFGEYVDYPDAELHEATTEECDADRFARRIKWPALLALAALEAAWLVALVYPIYRFIL
jgi:hypothetical protein